MNEDFNHWEDLYRIFDIKVIDVVDFTELLVRLLFNMAVIFYIAHYLYLRSTHKKDFYFSYLAVGAVTFLLCFLLNNVKLELGFALGLFAIFGIIRYRTDTIPIKEMTYLFVIIGVSVINALANKKISHAELLLTNGAVVFGLWFLENKLVGKPEKTMSINLEDIRFIQENQSEALMQQLKERTGLEIKRFEVTKIDYLRDAADVTVYYVER